MRLRSLFSSAGMIAVLVGGAALFAGCARVASTAEKIHSVTPCGIVMGKMMGHEHGAQAHETQAPDATEPQDTAQPAPEHEATHQM
jgi:hypothetical protein